jgi:DNA-binding CsgD family transcriptional regulator
MTQLNQWLSYGYGSCTLTVRYGDLQALSVRPPELTPGTGFSVRPPELTSGTASTSTPALEGTAPLPACDDLELSPRQREVLALIVQGLPNKEIARRLNLAVGTVKIHVAVLFHKMNVTSRTAAAVAGLRLLAASPPQIKAAA